MPNEKSGTISVIDTEKDEVIATIKAGDKPRGLAASKDGKTLYVNDQPNNHLVIIDLEKREAVSDIKLGESPRGSAYHRTARRLPWQVRSPTRFRSLTWQ